MLLVFSMISISQAQTADDDSFDEPAVVIENNNKTESVRLPNGNKHVKITPANGKPYCLEIRTPDPFDEFDLGSSARVRCRW